MPDPLNPLARRTIPLAVVALSLSFSTSTPATAQTTGTIEGTTIGTNGFPMSGALVTVTGAAASQESVTGADGSFRFADLAAGDYVVTGMLPGFETAERQVALAAGATETIQLVLQIAYVLDTLSVVAEESRIFARNFVPESMIRQQSKITNVMAVVDNLPGVSVQEGDAYGFDDWSSNVAVRGFQVTLSDVQIGTTIDGFPNGTSDYWGGAKANRFVDPMNLESVEVSQGTADIASR